MKKEKWTKSSMIALIALIVIIAIFAFIWWRISVFFKPSDNQQQQITPDELVNENEDYYCVQHVEESEDDGVTTILVLGDDSFAYERGAEGLVSLVADRTNSTIYNCSFEGSAITGDSAAFNLDNPIESFSLYWLLIALRDNNFSNQDVSLSRMENPPSYFEDTLELIKTIDYDTIDIVVLSFGINDYLAGHITTDVNDESSSGSVYGGLIASINIIQQLLPQAKVVVSSPSYAFYTEDDGSLTGGDFRKTGTQTSENLGGYMVNMKNAAVNSCDTGVTFIDNYFGVNINYENAEDYLIDSPIIPNLEGRILIADHIADVLNNRLY